MKVLGINTFGHDHSVFIIDTENEDIFAISLERVNRIKHDNNDLSMVVSEYPEIFKDIDFIALGGGAGKNTFTMNVGKSYISILKRRLLFYKAFRPKYKKDSAELMNKKVFNNPINFGLANFVKYQYLRTINRFFYKNDYSIVDFTRYINRTFKQKSDPDVTYYDHHLSHASSAYYFSGFDDEKVISLTIDGYGDDYYSKVFLCENGEMEYLSGSKVRKINGATVGENLVSIGTLFGNFTEAMDLRRNSEEGKVEALAAYGNHNNEIYNDLMKSCSVDSSIKFNDKIDKYYNIEFLRKIRQEYGDYDFCAAIQSFLNDVISNYVRCLVDDYGVNKICLSGGVAANVIMNLNIFEENILDDVFVFPAMADDGVAAGAAVLKLKEAREDITFLRKHYMPYWGPDINYKNNLEQVLKKNSDKIKYTLNQNWHEEVAQHLFNNKVGSLVIGKMEYGPRALGGRSIIASPLNNITRDKINKNIKRRPSYQPFCPSVLESERRRLFENSLPNKHMTFAFRLKEKYFDKLPSAVHIDRTGRPQFVEEKDNPDYYKLLSEFKKLCGFGVLINTSFNLHGRTIVRTPQDAIDDFIDCNLEFMVMGNYLIYRNQQ